MTTPQPRSSILGGILLILLGVLFLFAHWNPDLHLWHVLWHYWPVLIILWGVSKLVDHFNAQQSGTTRPPMVNGPEAALMVLVILVIAGMGLYSTIREKHPDLNIDINMFHEKADQMVDLPTQTIPAGSHVTLATEHGSITCHAGDTNELRVSATETASASNEDAAQQKLKTMQLAIRQDDGGYIVSPQQQSDREGEVQVDLDVTVPKSSSLTVSSNHGDINISGVAGKIAVTAPRGDIDIHDTGSDVAVDMSKGDIRMSGIAGNARLAGHGGEVEISDVAGDATVAGEFFGPVRIRNITKTTHYASQRADLTFAHLTGRLELDSEQIEVSDVGGAAQMATKNKDLDVENVAGRLEIADEHGDIKVVCSQPPKEDISIANESGGVDLTLPAKSNFTISAVSKSGEVQSDFESASGAPENENENSRFSAKFGTGVPKIDIATTYGTISLHKSS
jgi:hypothetical protein